MAKISFKERESMVVKGRKEYVKFSRINSFASMIGSYQFAIECGSQGRERFNLLVLSLNRSVFHY